MSVGDGSRVAVAAEKRQTVKRINNVVFISRLERKCCAKGNVVDVFGRSGGCF